MDAAEFIQLATEGDARRALLELERNQAFAAARDRHGVSVVCLTVYRRRAELAAALAAARSDLDVFEAACVGDLARVVRLVSEDVQNVNAVSPDGFGPAGYAAFFGHPAILRELIARGADLNAPSRNGMRVCPLHSAAAQADQTLAVELARIVLEAGADPNARQQRGFTAMHEAALNGNLPLIELLLAHGADAASANDEGVTPADLARSKGHDAAVQLLHRQRPIS
jgi:ankyrin repeat protein